MRRLGTWLLILALAAFAISAGIFVRDLGANYATSTSGPIDPSESLVLRFYAYELTYELAVFSTVRVSIFVEASFDDWRQEFESNGSFLSSFRPRLPGIHQVTALNLEDLRGQLGISVLLKNSVPPELETSILNPTLLATTILLIASMAGFSFQRLRQAEE